MNSREKCEREQNERTCRRNHMQLEKILSKELTRFVNEQETTNPALRLEVRKGAQPQIPRVRKGSLPPFLRAHQMFGRSQTNIWAHHGDVS